MPTMPHSHIELPALDCGLRRVRRFAFAMESSLDCEGIIAVISYRSVGFLFVGAGHSQIATLGR
jgi:hypothetical protein